MTQIHKEALNKATSIFITALLGAGIAFLQSLIQQQTGANCNAPDPAFAGTMGAGLRAAYLYIVDKIAIM